MSFTANNISLISANSELSVFGLYALGGNSFIEVKFFPNAVGEVAGYTSGGAPGPSNVIDKFPFATDTNATDVGDLTVARSEAAGQSSTVSGYTSGGVAAPVGGYTNFSNTIDKFPFAADASASDVGDLSVDRQQVAGQSSYTHGYSSGGFYDAPPSPNPAPNNTIDKFSFSFDENANDVGDLTQLRDNATAGQSSRTHGYTSGGRLNPPATVRVNTIDKFPFSTDTNASDVGDLTQARHQTTGHSSTVSGYTSGGGAPGVSNVIDKFPFATDTNASDVGDLTSAKNSAAGQSSFVSGYSSGGNPGPLSLTIEKFPFAIDTNASVVGDLTQERYNTAGQQD